MPKINQEEYEVLKGLDNRWKWIARDDENQIYSAELYVFEIKPEQEDGYWNNVNNGEYALLEERDGPFQFIQWEDEEPYEIAELIREYETEELRRSYFGPRFPKINGFYNANLATWVGLKESEETEVKKDIKWLKAEVERRYRGFVHKDDLISIINEVDEPEVLSKELPVIPEYVADWITEHRKNLDLYPALKKLEGNPMTWKSIYEWYRMNTHEFVNAYLTGEYIVEEEQRYYAKLKEVHPLEKEWLVNLTPSNYYVISTKGLRFGEFILDLVGLKSNASTYTHEGWGRYGINDSNADFVKVDE